MTFNNYAKYYDLLYKDKDYKKEIDYIDSLIRKHSDKKELRILDIGCGTGVHAKYLAEKGYHVTGIDLSEEMIKIAKENRVANTEFYVENATSFELKEQFDIVLSLFHVVSYQTANHQIDGLFSNVSKHLVPGGIFIFDFWYGPCVLEEKPSVRVKRLEDNQIKVFRIAEPVIHINENIVDVNYELMICNKSNGKTEFVNESHRMRYLFIPEIDQYLITKKINVLNYEEWLTGVMPSSKTWGVCCIARIS